MLISQDAAPDLAGGMPTYLTFCKTHRAPGTLPGERGWRILLVVRCTAYTCTCRGC